MDFEETALVSESGDTLNNDSGPALTETIINSYFSHNNVLSKNIISEQRALIKFLGGQWNELDCHRSETLLDLLFVEDDVRQQLTSEDIESIQESFPRLYLNSGQKINVDFENDLWTWRDEHSGPFSWMSRSQQDLTLTDLEPDNISKPQPKTLRVDTENPDNLKEAEHQFSYPANCWSRDVIDNYRKAERKITLSPCASVDFGFKKQEPVEEVKEAFEETTGDVQSSSPDKEKDLENSKLESQELQDASSDSFHKRKNSGKDKKRRSPSPKKILRSSSLRRSPSKSSDQGEQQLISKKSDDSYEEQNTFSNPLVETQWSSFVGENGNGKPEQEKDAIPMRTVNTYNFPTTQVMERGEEVSNNGSPYQVQRDNVNLITPSESPAQNPRGHNLYTATNELEGWSAESTPDHTTHLLKGIEKDKAKDQNPSRKTAPTYEVYEKEEVLTVKSQGNDIVISSETKSENKRDSDIPCTGFDFLDNW